MTNEEVRQRDKDILWRNFLALLDPNLSTKRRKWLLATGRQHVQAIIARHGEDGAERLIKEVEVRARELVAKVKERENAS